MKLKFEKKYIYFGITAFLVIAASICFYYLLFHWDRFSARIDSIVKIASPVLYGMILAYHTDNYYCYFSRLWFLFYYDPQLGQQYSKYFHGSSHLCEQSDEIHGQVF